MRNLSKSRRRIRHTVISFTLILLIHTSYAQSINWGNAANDTNIDSSGTGLDNVIYTFELGTFSNGDDPATEFTPGLSNTDFWGDRWITLDTASYDQEPAPTEDEGYFADSWLVENNTYQGFQAYIWVYNNQVGDETSEWVLITDLDGADAWKIPASTGTQQGHPDQWRVSTATDAIFGGLNDVDGPGETDSGTPTTFALQTNTFLPVPEAGTSILLGLTLGSLVMRRRREMF